MLQKLDILALSVRKLGVFYITIKMNYQTSLHTVKKVRTYLFFQFLMLFFLVIDVSAQVTPVSLEKEEMLSKTIVRILSSKSDISGLNGLKETYTFNIRLVIERDGRQIVVSKIIMTDSVGYKVFRNYEDLKNVDYSSLLTTKDRTTLVIPVIILNSPEIDHTRDVRLNTLSKQTFMELVSSLIDEKKSGNKKSLIQKNITLFEPYLINRIDIQ